MLLVEWQEGRPACKKTEWWGAGMVICLERSADLHMVQLMPLPLTVTCFSKIQIGFTFVVPAHLDSTRQRVVKRVCVCVCAYWQCAVCLCVLLPFYCYASTYPNDETKGIMFLDCPSICATYVYVHHACVLGWSILTSACRGPLVTTAF